jgi:hypothetical protein
MFDGVPEAARAGVDWHAKAFAAVMANQASLGDKAPKECAPEHHQDWARGLEAATEKIAWAMAEAGRVVDRRTDIAPQAVVLDPEPEDEEEAEQRDAALAGPTEAETAFEVAH